MVQPTSREDLHRAVRDLVDRRDEWSRLEIADRLAILGRLRRDTLAAASSWVEEACALKGIDPDAPVAAEEWMGGPMLTIRNVRLLEKSLREVRRQGRPSIPALAERSDGQIVVTVFPAEAADRLLYRGFRARLLMLPGRSRNDVLESAARAYRSGGGDAGRVALILGAGNVSSIGPMDVLHKIFVENRVCALKMHPVIQALGPHIERSFHALVERGFLRVVYGGRDEGAWLVDHDGVEEIHITGSDRVHDEIVWGPGSGEERKSGAPRLTKPITSELGCVTPVILVPGSWSRRQLEFQAENVASMAANNGSFNCNAARVLITHDRWPQRREFLARLKEVLAGLPARRNFYPGSQEKYDLFLEAHPEATRLGEAPEECLPWTVIEGVDAAREDDIAFRVEAWSPVLAETSLPGNDPASFLRRAVDFANDRLWGTLSCALLVDPRTQRSLGGDLDDAVVRLRYGTVAINHWPALGYGLAVTPWGAFPGHTLREIGSGIGFVHNTLMLEGIQKSVVEGPFTVRPRPPWFVTHRRAQHVARRLTAFEASPSILGLPGILLDAVRG